MRMLVATSVLTALKEWGLESEDDDPLVFFMGSIGGDTEVCSVQSTYIEEAFAFTGDRVLEQHPGSLREAVGILYTDDMRELFSEENLQGREKMRLVVYPNHEVCLEEP